uniref:DM2 domain-containing protein n=1 Tax=Meleagris gallopavo TaxID=9103 RepID=A0A803Y6I6_MELGA
CVRQHHSLHCSMFLSCCFLSHQWVTLHHTGAQGETFTLKEVMHYLGQYIMVRQLYDKRQQHMVYCGGDQPGELLGLESFSVKDPSPVYDMLKRNLTYADESNASAVSTSEHKCENYEDKDLIENLSESKKPKLDLVFEEWDVAGLPQCAAWCSERAPVLQFVPMISCPGTGYH